jgi:hypothetical protein
MFREAPARPIRDLGQGTDTGLPAILLGSETSWRRLGRIDVRPKTTLAPKTVSGPLSRVPVEMLSVWSNLMDACIYYVQYNLKGWKPGWKIYYVQYKDIVFLSRAN